ncbi:MAG: DUF5009 domain-containing protein [Bryobacterales bacterium]|nr:DUF5009 domain-containing protein [Bryobacterales bacterium]
MPTVLEKAAAAGASISAAAAPLPARLLSLDVFRGLTMASMVMVNNQGSGAYAPLRHAAWDGITFTDLVFPFFVWIVGVAMTLSMQRRVEQGQDRGALLSHAARRAAIIFGIGLFLNAFPEFELGSLRIPGVLQRIALCYFFATCIFLYTGLRGRIFWTVGLMLGYFVLMHPSGYLVDANVSDWLDRKLLLGHLYTPTRDPEGTVSTLTATATCMLGILTGHLLRARMNEFTRVLAMVGGGGLLLMFGLLLDPAQPINKNLWTNTYVMVAGGWAAIVFGVTYWICDVLKATGNWSKPFVVMGMNAIAVYMFHGLLGDVFRMIPAGTGNLRQAIFNALSGVVNEPNAWLGYSLLHVAMSLAFAWFLYSRRWFLKF